MNLIQMSVAAGILIFGIVLFRSLFVHRLPKKIMILLWEIAILRLLIPFSVEIPFPSPFAEMRSLIVDEQENKAEMGIFVDGLNVGENLAVNGTVVLEEKSGIDLESVIIGIYLTGTVILLAGSLFLYIRDSRLFREGLPMAKQEREKMIALAGIQKKDLRRLEKVKFQVSDRTATPVTYGLFRPAVVFPKGIYLKNEKEVNFCLQHELIHIRNYDNVKKLAAHLALCIHWFNPLVWVMYFLFNRDMELLCDETVVRRSSESRQDYALTLLSLAECRSMGFQTGLGFGKSAVKERIVAVMTFKKTTIVGMLAAIIAITSALTVFITDSVVHAQDKTETVAAREYALADDEGVSVTWEAQSADEVVEDAPSVFDLSEGTYNVVYTEYAADVSDTEMTYAVIAETADAASRYAQETTDTTVVQLQEATTDDMAYEGDDLPEGMEEVIGGLISEFEVYGLSGEVSQDDYQLYYNGEPVYFFADNKKQNGDGFSGRLFMREENAKNGYTGVITKYNENGELTGLIHLSVEESEAYTSPWR